MLFEWRGTTPLQYSYIRFIFYKLPQNKESVTAEEASLTFQTYLQLQAVCSPLCLVVVLRVNRSVARWFSTRAEHYSWRMSLEWKVGCSQFTSDNVSIVCQCLCFISLTPVLDTNYVFTGAAGKTMFPVYTTSSCFSAFWNNTSTLRNWQHNKLLHMNNTSRPAVHNLTVLSDELECSKCVILKYYLTLFEL